VVFVINGSSIHVAEAALAASNETPFFVFSAERIAKQYSEFEKQFPGARIHYAVKANAEPELLALLDRLGSGFEVASRYELRLLKALNVVPEKIIYGASVKPSDHIKEFAEYGVDRFACDSFPEVDKIAKAAPGARVYARVTVDDAASVFRFSHKFGIDRTEAVSLLSHARRLGLIPYGLSFSVGSQSSDAEAWARAILHVGSVLAELREIGMPAEVLNIGGGFPCDYLSSASHISLAQIAEQVQKACRELPYLPAIILEPGRGIVGPAGSLVTSVIARVERRGKIWLFMDVGVYGGLFETMAYQGSTRYRVKCLQDPAGLERPFSIAGPTGDAPDVIAHDALLPVNTDVGDKLVFHDVGAYSLVTASPFNGFPRPGVHFV
jgi:ornithine decarboxylase